MMPTKELSTSTVTADHPKGRQATDLFRAAYNKASLDAERGQVLNENPSFPKALFRLIEKYSMPIKAPQGGRIHVVSVPVNPARDWQEAIDALHGGHRSRGILPQVGDHYPPQEGPTKDEKIFLVNFGKAIVNGQYALDWAKPLGLKPADPRKVFAIGEHKLTLLRELGPNVIAVVSLIPCSLAGYRRVLVAWWGRVESDVDLQYFYDQWYDHDWFAFVRE